MSDNTNSVSKSFFQKLSNPSDRKTFLDSLLGDVFGGTAAMLVALPSAIAFGLIIFAPLGSAYSARAAISGIIGTIMIGIITPIFGGTKRLVSAPCAPAAAVLAVFVGELLSKDIEPEMIPLFVTGVALCAGLVQVLVGYVGGGKFIKYIPYPVVAGYLSGVGVLIFFGQLPKFLGLLSKDANVQGVLNFSLWRWESIVIGTVTMMVMVFSPRLTKKLPPSIMALLSGILAYFALSAINPALLNIKDNKLIIGAISASVSDIGGIISSQWAAAASLNIGSFAYIVIPMLTLAVLLSIDTLKTCVVLDALTYSRHNSNKELKGQGLGNIASALACGIPGAGTMGATLVNLNSGARTSTSGMIVGITAILVLVFFGSYIAWIPISALAGILIVVAVRMIDRKSFTLLKHSSTRFDFLVILAVVISAVSLSLIAAAGVGIGLAILLFLREQMRTSVIKKKMFGNQHFSKRIRLEEEITVLTAEGGRAIILELQGQLFFGTTDQLFSELEPYLKECKYVLLDMRRVLSIDYTAVNMLKQILARIKANNGNLVFASVPLSVPTGQKVKEYLEDLGLTETENLKFFDESNAALEWVEEEILKAENALIAETGLPLTLGQFGLFKGFSTASVAAVTKCLVEKSYRPGDLIFTMGEESDEIFFIRKGTIKIVLPLATGMIHHLATISRGGFFGDMSFLDKGTRSANAVAVDDVDIFILERAKFDIVTENEPEIAALFFERLAWTISHRLRQSNIELKALQEN